MCQFEDYPTHMWLCPRLKKYQDRPNEHMRWVIILHEIQKPPRWVWIGLESEDGNQRVILEPHLKVSSHGGTKVEYVFMYRNHASKTAPRDTLAIFYCDQNVHGDLGPNRSIQALGSGGTAPRWYGPIVVMKKLGLQTDSAAYGDMDLTAYRNVID